MKHLKKVIKGYTGQDVDDILAQQILDNRKLNVHEDYRLSLDEYAEILEKSGSHEAADKHISEKEKRKFAEFRKRNAKRYGKGKKK